MSPAVKARLEKLRGLGGEELDRERAGDEPIVTPLGRDRVLVALLCYRGASSGSETYFIVREHPSVTVERAVFRRPYQDLRSEHVRIPDFVLANPTKDLEEGTISHSFGTGSDGHCGEKGTWAWTGRAFGPLETGTLVPCGGASVRIPLYQTQ